MLWIPRAARLTNLRLKACHCVFKTHSGSLCRGPGKTYLGNFHWVLGWATSMVFNFVPLDNFFKPGVKQGQELLRETMFEINHRVNFRLHGYRWRAAGTMEGVKMSRVKNTHQSPEILMTMVILWPFYHHQRVIISSQHRIQMPQYLCVYIYD